MFNAIEKMEVAVRAKIVQIYAVHTDNSHWFNYRSSRWYILMLVVYSYYLYSDTYSDKSLTKHEKGYINTTFWAAFVDFRE